MESRGTGSLVSLRVSTLETRSEMFQRWVHIAVPVALDILALLCLARCCWRCNRVGATIKYSNESQMLRSPVKPHPLVRWSCSPLWELQLVLTRRPLQQRSTADGILSSGPVRVTGDEDVVSGPLDPASDEVTVWAIRRRLLLLFTHLKCWHQ